MNQFDEIARKRAILATARIRFSPEIQPVKENAINKITEQILYESSNEDGLIVGEIQDIFESQSGGCALNPSDMRRSLKELIANKRIVLTPKRDQERYNLSIETRSEIAKIQEQSEARFDSIINRLFKNAPKGSSAYKDPFLLYLSIIFSELGEENARMLTGDLKPDSLTSSVVYSALEDVKRKYANIDHTLFESAVTSFFRDSDPEYDSLKWNMAQNYYITKLLGFDSSGSLLSKEVFDNAVLYIDTNTIVPALEPRERHHKSFSLFANACKHLNVPIKVCQISLDELSDWITYQRQLIEDVIDHIPTETEKKVRSPFHQKYCEMKDSGGVVTFDEVFECFNNAIENLSSYYNVELEDDIWFDEMKEDENTKSFASFLKSKFYKSRKVYKKFNAAIHDALLLLWIDKLKNETDQNVWLVTMDTYLPGSVPQSSNFKSLAITLDAVLHWILPVAGSDLDENGSSTAFAEMIKYRILPQDKFFDLEDFRIFNKMSMSCKNFPAEDVEDCIRYIKVHAPTLDMSIPYDRERISYEVTKFLVSPDRKYKQDISRLEVEKEKISQKSEKEKQELVKTYEEEKEKMLKSYKGLSDQFKQHEKDFSKFKLKHSARIRLCITLFVFFLLQGIILYLASQFAQGQNLYQKVLVSWPFFSVPFGIAIILGWFFIGKERLNALGWPFTKLFKQT